MREPLTGCTASLRARSTWATWRRRAAASPPGRKCFPPAVFSPAGSWIGTRTLALPVLRRGAVDLEDLAEDLVEAPGHRNLVARLMEPGAGTLGARASRAVCRAFLRR
jgi:hypothetical protein